MQKNLYMWKILLLLPLEILTSLLFQFQKQKFERGKAGRVREDRFTIIVAGESKSGKSTFINAYLGIELLPMDVKQCTRPGNADSHSVRPSHAALYVS